MRSLVAVLIPVMLCAVPLVARGEDQPAPAAAAPAKAEDAASDTMAQVINQPRTVDTMARFWMVLYDACEAAKVPPGAVYVIDLKSISQTMSRGNVVHLDSAGMRMPMNWSASPQKVELGVAVAQFPALVEALTVACGRPTSYFPQAMSWQQLFSFRETEQFTATWSYLYSWPDTYKVAKDSVPMSDHSVGQLRAEGLKAAYDVQELSLATKAKKTEVTPELAAVTQKYGVVAMPVK